MGCPTCVSRQPLRCGGLNVQNFVAVHLLHEHRRHADGLRQQAAVGRHMRAQVSDMVAQIERLPRGL